MIFIDFHDFLDFRCRTRAIFVDCFRMKKRAETSGMIPGIL